MHFHKYPHAANFQFADKIQAGRSFKTRLGSYRLAIRSSPDDIHHLQVRGKGWETNDSQAGLAFIETPGRQRAAARTRLSIGADGSFSLEDAAGQVLLASQPGRFFGQCGTSSIFEFIREEGDQFYGLGEKWIGFEHSGKTTKFWNTDVWADFHPQSYIEGTPPPDPVYVSVPYLILKRGNIFIGLLLDNPYATFISTGFKTSIADQMEVDPGGEQFAHAVSNAEQSEFSPPAASPRRATFGAIHLGAEAGQPHLYLLVGPTLPELTRKFQRLVGTTPLPPAWALGYHQCRWGYESEKDLLGLDKKFREHGIPVDGLWLDIDYMRGYRVFTFDKKHFPQPGKAMARLGKAARKVVPIIDPGVKFEPGYDVYERGHAARAFCENPQGGEYVGLVWPGQTVFPDFSLSSARAWWAREVAEFGRLGIHGAWLDMNDPSTGPIDNQEMLFDEGRKPHGAYHNQYALGMAMATREGFLQAHPGQRPFLLCRSGFTGSNRYTAIWTGDNYSNYFHLKNSIATTLNLALSGIPFNGPDAGGFAGDSNPELMMDWFKAGFLFPVFRNHTTLRTRRQEPWAFGARALKVLRRFIQLRYRFRPYLYQLFAEQERTGEAILRPLFYDFEDSLRLRLGLVDDQFMVGPWILQAPFLEEKQVSRRVVLPGKIRWYDLANGGWLRGDRKISVHAAHAETPIYIRDGAILPLARLAPADHAFHSSQIDFHLFLAEDGAAAASYRFDDGVTFAYRDGTYSEVNVKAERRGTSLAINVEMSRDHAGPGAFTFSTPPEIRRVTINGSTARKVSPQGVAIGPKHFPTYAVQR